MTLCRGETRQRFTAAECADIRFIYELCDVLDWASWSSTLAAEISGRNPALFILWGLDERDGAQEQITHGRETAAVSGDDCWCLCTRTPRNDSTGSTLLSGTSEDVH